MIIGADERAIGGVSSVNRTILESDLINSQYQTEILRTWSEPDWKRAFLSALLKARDAASRADLLHVDLSVKGSCFRKITLMQLIGTGRKYILHLHSGNFFEFYNVQKEPARKAIANLFAGACKVCCVSDTFVEQSVATFRLRPENVVRVYNGVEVEHRSMPTKTEHMNVLYMGALSERRGIDRYLEIAKAFEGEKSVEFYAAGPGKQQDWEGHNVHYLGVIAGLEKNRILDCVDVLINPSRYESFGLSMVECMNHWAVCIGSKAGAIPEILGNGDFGILVGSKEEAIAAILGLSTNRQRLRDMQEQAYRRSLDFPIERFERGIRGLYDSCFE